MRDTAPLGVGATLGWVALVFVLAQAVGLLVLTATPLPSSVAAARYDGRLIAIVTLITNPVQIVALMAVAYRVGPPLAYLGLTGFRRSDLVLGLALVAGLIGAVDLFAHVAGFETVSPFQLEAFATARRDDWVLPLILAVVVVGPLGEEIVFRGFLFRGCVRPGLPGLVAMLLITMAWAALHYQYDLFGMTQVFLIGLVLIYMRWRSGSTTLAFILHALANAESTVETFVKLG